MQSALPSLEAGDRGHSNSEDARTRLGPSSGLYSKLPCLLWHPADLGSVPFSRTCTVSAPGFLLLIYWGLNTRGSGVFLIFFYNFSTFHGSSCLLALLQTLHPMKYHQAPVRGGTEGRSIIGKWDSSPLEMGQQSLHLFVHGLWGNLNRVVYA